VIFNSFQKEDDDSIFTIVRNVAGAARAAGDAVSWDTANATVDGVRVTANTTPTLSAFRGVMAEGLADSQYGRCQVHGYNTYAKVINNYTTAIAVGSVLRPSALANYAMVLTWGAAADGLSGFVVACDTYATGTVTTQPDSKTMKVLIRAL